MTDPAALARQTAEAHRDLDGPLLPVLHAVQEELGHIPPETLPEIAQALDLSTAEVHGFVQYYPDFRTQPPGRRVLRLCRAEACQAMGGAALGDAVRGALDVDWHGTSADGAVTLEPAYCLGLCACAPAAMIDDRLLGRATTDRILGEVSE